MPCAHPKDRLAAFLFGEDDDAALAAHVVRCSVCADELASLREVVARLPTVLPHAPAPRAARDRLLGSVEHLEGFRRDRAPLGGRIDGAEAYALTASWPAEIHA